MKKLLSMLLVVALIMGTLGTFALAADTQTVDIRNENGVLSVRINGKTSQAAVSATDSSIALGANSKGQLLVASYLANGKTKVYNLKVSASKVNIFGDSKLVNLAANLGETVVGLAKGSNVSKLNNRVSALEVAAGAAVGKLASVSAKETVINGSVNQLHSKAAGASVTVNGTVTTARAEGGSTLNVNGTVKEAQSVNGGTVAVAEKANVTTVKSVGGVVDVASGASVKTVAAKDAKITVSGSVETLDAQGKTTADIASAGKAGAIKANGEASVNVSKGAVADSINLSENAKGAVSGNVTGAVTAEGKASVEAKEGSKISEVSAKGESSVKAEAGSYVADTKVDEKANLAMDKGSESLKVTVAGDAKASVAGNANSVVASGNSNVKLEDGSKVAQVDNKNASNKVEMATGSTVGAVADNSKLDNKGGKIDPSIKDGVVSDKPIDPTPTTAPSVAPTTGPTSSTAPTTAPTSSSGLPSIPPVVPVPSSTSSTSPTTSPTTSPSTSPSASPVPSPAIAITDVKVESATKITFKGPDKLDSIMVGTIKIDVPKTATSENFAEYVAGTGTAAGTWTITMKTGLEGIADYKLVITKATFANFEKIVNLKPALAITDVKVTSDKTITFKGPSGLASIKVGAVDVNVANPTPSDAKNFAKFVADAGTTDKGTWTITLETALTADTEYKLVATKTDSADFEQMIKYVVAPDVNYVDVVDIDSFKAELAKSVANMADEIRLTKSFYENQGSAVIDIPVPAKNITITNAADVTTEKVNYGVKIAAPTASADAPSRTHTLTLKGITFAPTATFANVATGHNSAVLVNEELKANVTFDNCDISVTKTLTTGQANVAVYALGNDFAPSDGFVTFKDTKVSASASATDTSSKSYAIYDTGRKIKIEGATVLNGTRAGLGVDGTFEKLTTANIVVAGNSNMKITGKDPAWANVFVAPESSAPTSMRTGFGTSASKELSSGETETAYDKLVKSFLVATGDTVMLSSTVDCKTAEKYTFSTDGKHKVQYNISNVANTPAWSVDGAKTVDTLAALDEAIAAAASASADTTIQLTNAFYTAANAATAYGVSSSAAAIAQATNGPITIKVPTATPSSANPKITIVGLGANGTELHVGLNISRPNTVVDGLNIRISDVTASPSSSTTPTASSAVCKTDVNDNTAIYITKSNVTVKNSNINVAAPTSSKSVNGITIVNATAEGQQSSTDVTKDGLENVVVENNTITTLNTDNTTTKSYGIYSAIGNAKISGNTISAKSGIGVENIQTETTPTITGNTVSAKVAGGYSFYIMGKSDFIKNNVTDNATFGKAESAGYKTLSIKSLIDGLLPQISSANGNPSKNVVVNSYNSLTELTDDLAEQYLISFVNGVPSVTSQNYYKSEATTAWNPITNPQQ